MGKADLGVPDTNPPESGADPMEWARFYWQRNDLGEAEDAFIAMCSVLRFQRLMSQTLDAGLRPFQINLTDYLLLMALALSETGTLLISRIARSLLVHATTATLATDRLEARQLLRRDPHPTDRRAIEVSLTDAGRALLAKVTQALGDSEFGMAGTSTQDRRRLVDLLTVFRISAGDEGAAPIETGRPEPLGVDT